MECSTIVTCYICGEQETVKAPEDVPLTPYLHDETADFFAYTDIFGKRRLICANCHLRLQ